jgi:hypothetical protein
MLPGMQPEPPVPPADPRSGGRPAAPADSAESGVDLSLIHWMLSLSPTERLEALQGFVDSVAALRDGRDA